MNEDLELLKKDLIHQLSFEDIDWHYFSETLERAIEADETWQDILNSSEDLKNTMAITTLEILAVDDDS